MIYEDKPSGLDAIDFGGEPRLLGRIPADPDYQSFKRFKDVAPVIPSAKWEEIDSRGMFPPEWILDQDGHGSCVGFSSAGALMRSIRRQGRDLVRLSGTDVYCRINGGRDQGAIITDAVKAVQEGVCLESQMPPSKIWERDVTPEAKATRAKYRALECYIAETFQEIGSAIQMGFIPIFAVMVGSNFTHLDGDGIAGFSNGPGNHAVHADGLRKLPSGIWVLDMPNSWGVSFGQKGRCFLTQRHVESVQQDCYVIRAAMEDPDSGPPVAK